MYKNTKKRILIPIVGKGSIVHIIRSGLLNRIKEFCEPVMVMAWYDEDLVNELKAKDCEVHLMPEFIPGKDYLQIRRKINFWYLNYVLKTASTKIQRNYLWRHKTFMQRLNIFLSEVRQRTRIKIDKNYIPSQIIEEDNLLKLEKSYQSFSKWIINLSIEGVFTVTPFLIEVEWIARICKEQNFFIIASIHSFDNITKRNWPAIFFDHYIVWNNYNKAELQRINPLLAKNITVAGAPQFDLHYNADYIWPRAVWLKNNRIPEGKKVILYAGGAAAHILKNEPQYIKHIVDSIDDGTIENAVLLFRCHPLDNVERWKEFAGNSPNIVYDFMPTVKSKKDHQNMTDDDVVNLISTLAYSDVHINMASTMAVDGSIFDKPQIGPFYDEVDPKGEALMRRLYYQEHYKPIINSGVVQLANSKQHLITFINEALLAPEKFTGNCQKCVNEIITYTDGKSAERVADVLKHFFA